jgi:Zn-dependent peptidase ImmA (M78 family)/transcriptional regulator with XRE-family HTH domain
VAEITGLAREIRTRRKALRLTQGELAADVGFSTAQIVSDIERDQREVKAWELVKIARALHATVDELLGIGEAVTPVRVLWRRGSSAASRNVEEKFLERARRFALLEKWNGLPPSRQLPQQEFKPDAATFGDVARMAVAVGRVLDLGSRPAASLTSVLQEAFGVKLFVEPLGDGESAASAKGDFGYAVLMNASQAPWRRNYNLAHELFHLVTWDSTQKLWPREDDEPQWLAHAEKLADAFASHLLLPAEEVEAQHRGRFPAEELDYADLVEMAREFEVSSEALVWRLRLMGKLTQDQAEGILENPQFRKEDRRTMPDYWGAAPRGPLPQRYWRLALSAYRRGELSLARLADILEIPVSEAGAIVMTQENERQATTAPT